MNLKKSINVALAKEGKNGVWLAEKLGMHREAYYNMLSRNSTRIATVEIMAVLFDMKMSEFIALGEE